MPIGPINQHVLRQAMSVFLDQGALVEVIREFEETNLPHLQTCTWHCALAVAWTAGGKKKSYIPRPPPLPMFNQPGCLILHQHRQDQKPASKYQKHVCERAHTRTTHAQSFLYVMHQIWQMYLKGCVCTFLVIFIIYFNNKCFAQKQN